MKITILKNMMTYAVVMLFNFTGAVYASGEAPPVLDFQNHPRSPEHNDIYTGDLLSLDANLSWKNRFNGDETFNEDEMLPQSFSSASMAQKHEDHSKSMEGMNMDGMSMDGMGVVKTIRLEQGKVKISHGPIEKYGMPEMTMMFKVEDPSMLEKIEKGQEVGFNVDNSSGGFVVTHIMPAMEMSGEMMSESTQGSSGDMDALGTVKVVRASQGKVKIQHGPIDKYGMPSMTMMFKVTDPAMLDGLQADDEVQFNVDNSSGGFVVTDIKPTGQ